MKTTFDAREIRKETDSPMSMDMNKMLQQVRQMQADMLKAQEELANERVEASVGGGMVTVTASGAARSSA